MPGFLREHSGPVAVSVTLHGILGLSFLLAAFFTQRHAPPAAQPQPLPIDAVVVDSQVLHAAQRAQADRVAQESARLQAEADAKAAAAAQEQADRQAAAEAQATAAATDAANASAAAIANARAAAEAQAADAAELTQHKRAAEARKSADAKLAADAKRSAEAKQAADVRQAADARQAAEAKLANEAKRAADDRGKKEREQELRRQMADEERVSAVESGPLRDRYVTLLRNKIQGAWNKPPTASAGVDCMVAVTQLPGGEVTNARVTQCNGDAAVRQSIENAVYRSSPLPDPPDPALFERNFIFRFRPNE